MDYKKLRLVIGRHINDKLNLFKTTVNLGFIIMLFNIFKFFF